MRHYLACAALAGSIFALDVFMPLGVAGGVPYIAVVLLSLRSPHARITLAAAAACTVLTLLGIALSPRGGELWVVVMNRSLAILALWISAVLALHWKQAELRRFGAKTLEEKEKVYIATMRGAHHILNNLMNQVQLLKWEADKHPDFDPDVLKSYDLMIGEATSLMQRLSQVERPDEAAIIQSIAPEQHPPKSTPDSLQAGSIR